MIINLNKPNIDYALTIFPDGQPHVELLNEHQLEIHMSEYPTCEIEGSILDCDDLIILCLLSNILDRYKIRKQLLSINYLFGARSDRSMNFFGSFDLKVIASIINSCGFERVNILDPHSEVSTLLIDNSFAHYNWELIRAYDRKNAVLICPDIGATKKIDNYLNFNKGIKDIVYCVKNRDLSNGAVTLKVLEPEKCQDRSCVIIDDICDGGATFLAIAKQIHCDFLTLIVTHGIFSKGFYELDKYFNEIITTDSMLKEYDSKKVKVIRCI